MKLSLRSHVIRYSEQ